MTLAKIAFRILSLIGKEVVDTLRRPGAALSLALGPFVILALFGLGYDSVRDPFRAIVVVQPASGLSTDPATWQGVDGGATGVEVVGVVASETEGRQALQTGSTDLLVIAPAEPRADLEAGRQSTIRVEYDLTDPIRASYADVAAREISAEVNRQILTRAVAEGEAYALRDPDAAGPAADIPPDIVASPTRAEAVNLSPTTPGVVPFFGPAAIALIIQHMALTLVALSLVKERTSGVIELFRISPVTTTELVLGKFLSFGGMVAAVAGLTLAALVLALGVPMLAGVGQVAAVVAGLIGASVGLGLLLGTVSDSDRQAVQLSLLVLLASVFFSGLVLPVTEFVPAIQVISDLLPVTHAMRLLQDLMLTGATDAWWQLGALLAIATVTLLASWLLLRRRMTRL
jgi:ABC-2 type transport system permease protein